MDTAENKKLNLGDLSKDELVKKCKVLISLAQKAKITKEDLQEENNKLKEQLTQKAEYHSNASYEVVTKITEEKLGLVTQTESLKLKNNLLEDKVRFYEKETGNLQEKINELETKNISYKRQVKRLTDENDQLLTDLSTMEREITQLNNLGTQQQEQLLQLEKTNVDNLRDLECKLSNSLEEIKKLNNSLKIKEKEIKELSEELQALKIIKNSSIYNSNKNCDIYVREISDLKNRNEVYSKELFKTENLNKKLKEKVILYHSKLKKFAQTIKDIKEERNQVLQIFKSYTEQIKEWKEQLFIASKQLVNLVDSLEYENKVLKESTVDVTNINSNRDLLEKLENCEQNINMLKKLQEDDKEEFNTTLKELREECESKLKSKNKELLSYKEDVDRLRLELITKEKSFKETVSAKKLVELENQKLIESISNYRKEIDNITQELISKEIVLKENIDACEKYNTISEKLISYEEKIANLNKELASQAIILQQENTNLNDALKHSMDTEILLANKSSEEIIRLAESNKKLEETVSKLKLELLQNRSNSFVNNWTQTESNLSNINEPTDTNGRDLKRENSELLLEMNQMNQALKERGEVISQLEAHCEEIKKILQHYETQANKNVDSISQKEDIIKSLSKELELLRCNNLNVNNEDVSSTDGEIVAGLKAEIETLKEKFNNSFDSNYVESETMSTSTISKCEEVNRLKDLEGPWEERYGKLRTLAIKLKAKIKEQVVIITEQQAEKEELQIKLSNAFKTVHSFQSQIDNVQDDLDKANGKNKEYLSKLNMVAENISKDKQLLVENEETIVILKKEIETLNTEKVTVENWKKQVAAKVQTLRKELETKNLIIKEFEATVSKVKTDLESKDLQLKNEQETHKHTKSLLNQTTNESKKNSVLNLEMQDYERSVKELSQKIEKQKTDINNLQTQCDMQKSTVNALREQNKLLEERVQEGEKNGNTTLLEITTLKKKIVNLEELLQQKEDKILDMTKFMEITRSENEELSTELSKVITEHQKSLNMLKSERDQLRNQRIGLQQSLREAQDNLKLKKDELMVIQEDYETYKVRAQSVLKKNQNRDLGLEEKLLEELATHKSQNNELSNAIRELRDKFKTSQCTVEEITKEKDELNQKCRELEIALEEIKSYSEQLAGKYQKISIEHAETVRNLKVHTETLSQCYRQQLSDQEVRHNREIIELQSRVDKAASPVDTMPIHPNMPREEGEGSESIESNSPPNNVHPIPLERLLDSKSDDEGMHLKKQVFEQESKVVHLTALLSDTEQDLVKHVQMNKLLKEEIRRQQRSVEREKHAENLEYLKNVIFKFITLSTEDERTRLVPVLNTILKLSPEETQKLLMVAKGDAGSKGWASYLPMWSSPNKPQ